MNGTLSTTSCTSSSSGSRILGLALLGIFVPVAIAALREAHALPRVGAPDRDPGARVSAAVAEGRAAQRAAQRHAAGHRDRAEPAEPLVPAPRRRGARRARPAHQRRRRRHPPIGGRGSSTSALEVTPQSNALVHRRRVPAAAPEMAAEVVNTVAEALRVLPGARSCSITRRCTPSTTAAACAAERELARVGLRAVRFQETANIYSLDEQKLQLARAHTAGARGSST